jgi:ribosomal-protein-serine acetyltransferase
MGEGEIAMAHDRPMLIDIPGQFVGARVVVRPFMDGDAAPVHEAVRESIEHLRPWLPWYDTHDSLDDTREYVRGAIGRWLLREGLEMGIFARDTGLFLGGVGLHVRSWRIPAFEIGYWLRQSAEGRGYMGEAVRLLTTFAFEGLEARRVEIRCDARNTRSAAVPRRLGYALEGCLRHQMLDPAGKPRDTLVYAMIPADYERVRDTLTPNPTP